MTTIIGFVDKKEKCVYMGCDSRMSIGSTLHLQDTQSKIISISNKILIGMSGDLRDKNIIESSKNIANLVDKNNITRDFLLSQFIPILFDEFIKNRSIKNDSVQYNSQYLLAYKNKLFYIDSYGTLVEPKDLYWSIGSGSNFALGSLYNKNKGIVQDEVILSLKVASYFDKNTGGPFYIYNTKDFKKIKK